MTDQQMLKEIIERRKQWLTTRASDFNWLIDKVEQQQQENERLRKALNEISDSEKQFFGRPWWVYTAQEALKGESK